MKPLLSLAEAARYLAVSHTTVYRLISKGKLEATKVGGQFRIRREAIEKMLKQERAER